MSDYRLKLSIRNDRILRAIADLGYQSVAGFCREMRLNVKSIRELIAFTKKPILESGVLSQNAAALVEAVGLMPEELWTDKQLDLHLEKAFETSVDEDFLERISNAKVVERLLSECKLTKNEILVVRMRSMGDKTLLESAEALDLSRERIRQIERKALRKLRHRAALVRLESPGGKSLPADKHQRDLEFLEQRYERCSLCHRRYRRGNQTHACPGRLEPLFGIGPGFRGRVAT